MLTLYSAFNLNSYKQNKTKIEQGICEICENSSKNLSSHGLDMGDAAVLAAAQASDWGLAEWPVADTDLWGLASKKEM